MRAKILVFMVAVLFILTGLSTVYAENKTISHNIEQSNTIREMTIDEYQKSYDTSLMDHQLIDRYKDNLNSKYPIGKPTFIDDEYWDIIVPDDYQTIQEAIDHAHEYNIILVRSGIYYEHIIVDVNAIQIIGEDLNNTIIDAEGSENVVEIKSFMVGLHGLNFRNGEIGVTFTGIAPTFNIVSGNVISQNQKK